MTKSTAFLFFIFCFIGGFVAGQSSMEEKAPEQKQMYRSLLTDMTSQGRAAMLSLKKELRDRQAPVISDIYFGQTQMFKEIAAETPDNDTVFKKSAEIREKLVALQKDADNALLNALLKMPLHDRETYLRHHLINREYLTGILIIQPLMTEIKSPAPEKTGRPRDAVLRKTIVPEL